MVFLLWAFIVLIGCQNGADYCSRNEVHEIEDSLRPQDFRLSWKAADALERTKLPHSLDWEKKTLIQIARSIREEDLHRDFTQE